PDTMSDIAERFDKARERAGFSDAKSFCDAAGVQESTISRLKTGKRGIAVPTLVKIAEKLNVSVDWLLTGREENRPPIYTFSETSLVAIRKAIDIALSDSESGKR